MNAAPLLRERAALDRFSSALRPAYANRREIKCEGDFGASGLLQVRCTHTFIRMHTFMRIKRVRLVQIGARARARAHGVAFYARMLRPAMDSFHLQIRRSLLTSSDL